MTDADLPPLRMLDSGLSPLRMLGAPVAAAPACEGDSCLVPQDKTRPMKHPSEIQDSGALQSIRPS